MLEETKREWGDGHGDAEISGGGGFDNDGGDAGVIRRNVVHVGGIRDSGGTKDGGARCGASG